VLRTRDEHDDLREFSVRHVYQTLYIRPPSPDPTGPGPWKIVQWREFAFEPFAESWGQVKQYYRHAADVPVVWTLLPVDAPAPPDAPTGCGTLVFNADEGYEQAYAWGGEGVAGVQGGAFAECYFGGNTVVCSAVFDLTQDGNYRDQTMDVFVWAGEREGPGPVVGLRRGADPGAIARWPAVSRHVIPIASWCISADSWWVGYVGNWRGEAPGWFVAVDQDGFGGCPYAYASGGSGHGEGWRPVSSIFGPAVALGIGAEVNLGPVDGCR
jgi:hypothetical protein